MEQSCGFCGHDKEEHVDGDHCAYRNGGGYCTCDVFVPPTASPTGHGLRALVDDAVTDLAQRGIISANDGPLPHVEVTPIRSAEKSPHLPRYVARARGLLHRIDAHLDMTEYAAAALAANELGAILAHMARLERPLGSAEPKTDVNPWLE